MEEKKKVGIWIRVSPAGENDRESPEHHEVRARKYCEIQGWEIVTLYDLSWVSGKTVVNHPEYKRMLQDIADKKITGIVFSKLARLARNNRELMDFCDFFNEHDADLISISEKIDTSSPAGRMFYTLMGAMAQFERETIAERVKASVPIRAELGKSLGGQAPYGYKWVDKKLALDEEEAPIRKHMYDIYLDCKGISTTAKKLNEKGYRTRKGAKFSTTTVERLLTDPIAKGMRRTNYTESLGDGKQWKKKDREEWVIQQVPAIISEELWQEVNDTIKTRKTGKKRRSTTHLFSGLTFCHCGEKMYIRNKNKYTCEVCRNKIPDDDLEAIFHSELEGVLLNKAMAKNILTDTQKEIENKKKLLVQLDVNRKELKEQMNQLLKLERIGQIQEESFKEHYQPVFEQYNQIANQIPTLEEQIKTLESKTNITDSAIQEAKNVQGQWDKLSRENKKKIVEIIVRQIIVEEDAVIIHLIGLPKKNNNSSNSGGNTNPLYKTQTNYTPSSNDHPTSFNPQPKLHTSTWVHASH